MPRDLFQPKDDLQEPSWRTRELSPELRRKLFEKVVPQNGPRARPGEGPDLKRTEAKHTEPKHADQPKARRQPKEA